MEGGGDHEQHRLGERAAEVGSERPACSRLAAHGEHAPERGRRVRKDPGCGALALERVLHGHYSMAMVREI